MLEHGANPNLPENHPPIIWAAGNGQTEIVQALLAKGSKPEGLLAVLGAGDTLLGGGNMQRARMGLYAYSGVLSETERTDIVRKAEARDTAIVQALLDHGLDLTKEPNRSALISASASGNLSAVRLLLESGAPVNTSDVEQWSTLEQRLTQEAIAERADAKAMAELVEALESGEEHKTGLTPLLAAAAQGHPEIVRLLLERGANPMQRDRKQRTALLCVAAAGRSAIARNLPQYREGILHRANEGEEKPVSNTVSPLEKSRWQRWAVEGDSAIVQALLEKQVDINARDAEGRTALMAATAQSSPEVAKLLLAAKADVNLRDNSGQTALMQVITRGRFHHAPELFSHGLQVEAMMMKRYAENRPDAQSKTNAANAQKAEKQQKAAVLQEATRGDIAMLKLLLASGADLNARDAKGRTALQLATLRRYNAAAQLLKQAGAKP